MNDSYRSYGQDRSQTFLLIRKIHSISCSRKDACQHHQNTGLSGIVRPEGQGMERYKSRLTGSLIHWMARADFRRAGSIRRPSRNQQHVMICPHFPARFRIATVRAPEPSCTNLSVFSCRACPEFVRAELSGCRAVANNQLQWKSLLGNSVFACSRGCRARMVWVWRSGGDLRSGTGRLASSARVLETSITPFRPSESPS